LAKAIFSFTLPDEESEFRSAINGSKLQSVLWSLDQHLRNRIKHEDLPAKVHDALQHTRDELYSLLSEHGVSLDE
jgi:hypothetical protein